MKKLFAMLLCLVLLAGCGAEKPTAKSCDVNKVMEALDSQYGLTENMLVLTETDLAEFYGIDTADVKQYAARVNTIGIDCEEVVLIEAKDAEAAARVEEQLKARYEAKCNEMENYLPEQYKIIKACEVKRDGLYVTMIVSTDAEGMTEIYQKSFA